MEKKYSALKGEKLVLNNEYGNVIIHTWDKKAIDIYITISAKAGTKIAAKELASRVTVNDVRNEQEILCSTNILTTDTVSDISGERPGKCTINYVVYMPDSMPLKITNQFGDIYMGNYNGPLEIEEKFGDFIAGNVKTIDSLNLQLGNISISNIGTGSLTASGFGNIKIDTVSGNVSCNFVAGKTLDIGLANKLSNLMLLAKNVQMVDLQPQKGLSANIDISAVLSKFINTSTLKIVEDSSNAKAADAKLLEDAFEKRQLQNDTTGSIKKYDSEKLISKKRWLELHLSKRPLKYHYTPENGTGSIKIEVVFCALRFK